MFKRKFKNDFDFFENSSLYKNENVPTEFDRSIFVIYDKSEVLEFLKLDKKETNVLVLLFNKQLYDSLSFLEEIKSLILLDNSKTRVEITKELKEYFKSKKVFGSPISEIKWPASHVISTQYNSLYKALFSLM